MVTFVFGIGEIGERLPVDLLRHLGQRRAVRIGVVRTIAFRIGIGKLAALLLIQFAHLQEDRRQNVLIQPRLPGGGSATFFHCSQRAELTNVPSFSAKPAPGRR